MSDERSRALRLAIRAKIDAGLLVTQSPRSIVTHDADYHLCDGCGAAIAPERMCEASLRSGAVLRLHQGCLVIWQDEAAKALLAVMRAKVTSGALPLPDQPPKTVWAGKGAGQQCDGCGQAITDKHIEYETD